MAKTLAELQIGVRHHARDDSLVLTDTNTLASVNRIYRNLASLLPWPELRRQDTSITTISGTTTYNWPTTINFLDIRSVEIQDDEDNNYYRLVTQAKDELAWNESSRKPKQSIPDYYILLSSTNPLTIKVEFRPAPKYASKTVRITGIIEPDELPAGTSHRTVFRQKTADDALEMLIAADWVDQSGGQEGHFWADKLRSQSGQILQQIFGKDNVPDDFFKVGPKP